MAMFSGSRILRVGVLWGMLAIPGMALAQFKITDQKRCLAMAKADAELGSYKPGMALEAQNDSGTKVGLKLIRADIGSIVVRVNGGEGKCPQIVGYTLTLPPASEAGAEAKPEQTPKAQPEAKNAKAVKAKTKDAKDPKDAKNSATKPPVVKKNFISIGVEPGYQSETIASTGKPSVKGIAYGGYVRYEGRGGVLGPVFGVGGRKFSGNGTDTSRDIQVKLTMDTLGLSALSGIVLSFESVPKLRLYGLLSYEFGLSGTMKFDNADLVATSYKMGSQSRLGGDVQTLYSVWSGLNVGLNLSYFGGSFKYTNAESNDRFTYTGYSADFIVSYDF